MKRSRGRGSDKLFLLADAFSNSGGDAFSGEEGDCRLNPRRNPNTPSYLSLIYIYLLITITSVNHRLHDVVVKQPHKHILLDTVLCLTKA